MRPAKVLDGIKDGVEVQPYIPPVRGKSTQEYFRANDAAEALVDFLHSYNWQAQKGFPRDATGQLLHDDSILPPGSIRIQIGLYPSVTYITPPGAKELSDAVKKDRDELRRRLEGPTRKWLDSLPPDQRSKAEQSKKQFDKDFYKPTNPCQELGYAVTDESPIK